MLSFTSNWCWSLK